jgi:DNA-directed RNA polymerase subunit RPC12/RpoP
MAELIMNCGYCGSREFTVVETGTWRANADDAGVLNCANAENGIDRIDCATCGKSYAINRFARIDFN